MKKALHLILAIALAFGLALVLCGSGCDEDGDGAGQVRSLEKARAIADPIAEAWDAWNPAAYNWFVTSAYVDDGGLLLPAGDSVLHFWQFRYNNNVYLDYVVTVYSDGTHIEFEQVLGEILELHGIPSYTNENVESLMFIATTELTGYLGSGDYMYTMTLEATYSDDWPNSALITAYTKYAYGQPGLAWVYLNADTGEVLVRSWD